jgi:hypothetical protein
LIKVESWPGGNRADSTKCADDPLNPRPDNSTPTQLMQLCAGYSSSAAGDCGEADTGSLENHKMWGSFGMTERLLSDVGVYE